MVLGTPSAKIVRNVEDLGQPRQAAFQSYLGQPPFSSVICMILGQGGSNWQVFLGYSKVIIINKVC